MADQIQEILEILEILSKEEFGKFTLYLSEQVLKGCTPIPLGRLEDKDRTGVVALMKSFYVDKMVTITLEIIKKIPRNDLIERLRKRNLENDMDIREQTVRKRKGATLPSSAAAASDYSPEGKRTRTMDKEPVSEAQLGGAQSMIFNASVLTSNHQDLETEKNKCALSVQEKLKTRLKKKFEYIYEGVATPGKHAQLNSIYTELYITEGDCEGVNNEHEVWQIENATRTQPTLDTKIDCNKIFEHLSGQEIRTVLTKGIAGIGKTVSVHKFILDWANGKANQDIEFIFVLPFRELNLINDEQHSLIELVHVFHPEMKDFKNIESGKHKVLFIFDGLDESRLPLNFQGNKILTDATKTASVDRLLTNLIKGELLPSALVWITSRPAAANQISPQPDQRLTEIRGFRDEQKEEYFRKRFTDENLADRVISHIKASRSLYIMCHIPVFCWISASVLGKLLRETNSGEIPKSLTEMYSHLLFIQSHFKNKKFEDKSEMESKKLLESNKDILLKLGQLAFQNLENGNLMFYEEDLINCGIDVTEASVYSGLCTEILKKESLRGHQKVYYFVHLSLQEYLAALYVIHSFTNKNYDALTYFFGQNTLTTEVSLFDLHKKAVQKALESKNGHLDLFLRFLLGLSLDSNQRLLQGLLTQTASNSESIQKTVKYIKELKRNDPSPERCINLFHCLSELNDDSLVKRIQKYLSSENVSAKRISPGHCSALAYVLLMSEKELDEFDLRKYNTSDEGRRRLVPAVKCCRKAVLADCNLTEKSCETVAAALQLAFCPLIELDISNNNLGNTGVEWLCAGLRSPNCKLQSLSFSYNKLECKGVKLLCDALILPHCKIHTLRLNGCCLDEEFCKTVISVLQSGLSPLRELTIRELTISNKNSAVELLRFALMKPDCKLQTLSLGCNLTEKSCELVISTLQSTTSPLRELVISKNNLGDSGVKFLCAGITSQNCKPETLDLSSCNLGDSAANLLCAGLVSPNCKLQTLRLADCNLTYDSCETVAAAMQLDCCPLIELDISNNNLENTGVERLCSGLKSPNCKLQILDLSRNDLKGSGVKLLCDALILPHCKIHTLRLSGCYLDEEFCKSVISVLQSGLSLLRELTIRELRISNNNKESAVELLRAALMSPDCKLQTLSLGCNLTEKSYELVISILQSTTSHLRELVISKNKLGDSVVKLLCAGITSKNFEPQTLDLSYCNLGDSAENLLCAGLVSPNCKLQTLRLGWCNLTEGCCDGLSKVLRSPHSELRDLELRDNGLQDFGVIALSAGLEDSQCKLQKLGLSGCQVTERGCASLASALRSNPSHLRELDLSYNHPGESGVRALSAVLEDPSCRLDTLLLGGCNLTEESCELVISTLHLNTSPLRELDISENNLGDSGVKLFCAGITSQNCKLQTLRLGWCNLTEGCCDDLSEVLHSPYSELRDLELRDNGLQDSGVIALSAGLEDSQCKLQRLGLSGCQVTERGCASLASALRLNPSHLRELDLSYNHPGELGVRALSAVLEDPSCRLETLLVDHGGENRTKPGLRKYGCQFTLDPNTAHRRLSLSEGNRKVTHTQGREEPYPDHPERFDFWEQVVCRECVCERCYWEAEFSEPGRGGWVHIAVTDKGISRKGGGADCRFGANKNSWSLARSRGFSDKLSYFVWHNQNQTPIPAPPSPYRRAAVCDGDDDGRGVCVYRVGVCVDRPAGTLSFYSVSDSDTMTLLHRVHTHFTQHTPLCAGFRVKNSSLSLCQLE